MAAFGVIAAMVLALIAAKDLHDVAQATLYILGAKQVVLKEEQLEKVGDLALAAGISQWRRVKLVGGALWGHIRSMNGVNSSQAA